MGPWRRSLLSGVLAIAAFGLAAGRPAGGRAQIRIVPGGRVTPARLQDSQPEGNLAQNVFSQPNRKVLQRLDDAQKLLEQARYGEAVRLLGELLRDPVQGDPVQGDPVQGDPVQGGSEDYFFQPDRNAPIHRSLKAEAQRLISQMPARGRELYELQYGSQARRWLEEAIAKGDSGGFGKVSRCFFHTRAGYEATLLLGLNHLDRCRPLAGALTLGRLRQSAPGGDRFEPTLSLATATCWLQAGAPEKAREVLSALKKRQAGRGVTIAGSEVALFAQEKDPASWLAGLIGPQGALRPVEPDRWVMFRGSPSRNAAGSGSAPLLNLRWRIPLTYGPTVESILGQLQRARREHGYPVLPSLHPLAVHKEFLVERSGRPPMHVKDVVLMRTVRNLVAVDFATGKRLWEVPVDDPLEALMDGSPSRPLSSPSPQLASALGYRVWDDAAYGTLSSDGRYAFTIEDLEMAVGSSSSRRVIIGGAVRKISPKSYNRLAAHDIRTGKLKWHLGGPSDQFALRMAETFFLGPPLPLMGQLYVLAEVKQEIRLLALEAATGDLIWSQQLAIVDRDILADPVRRLAGVSPSYCDGILVCPTSSGAVVAVDLATRSLLWGFRYERPATLNRYAQIAFQVGRNPALWAMQRWADASLTIVGGRVLVTPIESQQLHCLNLIDGQRLWKHQRQGDLYVACAHRDKVILVGARQVRALKLDDGKPAWDGGGVELPEGAMPSGRGFLSGDRYFLPLTTAEVLAVDLDAAKIVGTSKSRKGHVPGNLISYKGRVISQGFDGVEAYYQMDSVDKEIDRRLAADPLDPVALSLRGETLLEGGKHARAIEFLRRAHELEAGPRNRSLLRDAMLDGLQKEFALHRHRAPQIEPLLDTPRHRATYLRLMALGLQNAGELPAALGSYLKLIELDQQHRGATDEKHQRMMRISESHSVRCDRWVQARLAALRRQMGGQAPQLDRVVQARLQEAIQAQHATAPRQFLDYFGNHALAAKARDELFARLKGSGKWLQAELLIWDRQRSTDPALSGAAVAELAEMLRRADCPRDAAACYRRLGREFADVACTGGKTGKELLAGLPDDGEVRRVLRGDAAWPAGDVKVSSDRSKRARALTHGRYPLEYRGGPAPFFRETTVRFDQSRRQIQARDALGNLRWQASLVELDSSSRLRYHPSATHGRVCGHLLVISVGSRILAVDASDGPEGGTRKLLWSQDLTDPAADAAGMPGIAMFPPNLPLGWRAAQIPTAWRYAAAISALGPVTSRYVCLQRYRNLIVADPLTGEVLWVRGGFGPGNTSPACTTFGDDRLIFSLAEDREEAQVFRALDGELLGTRKIPRAKNIVTTPSQERRSTLVPFSSTCMAMLGRQLLLWRPEEGHYLLELFDPWQQRRVWGPRKFAATAQTALVDGEAIGVFEKDGRFTLIGLSDGRVITDVKLKPEELLSAIYVLRLGDQYVLVTSRPRTQPMANVIPQPLPGTSYRAIYAGRVYAFDLQGKPIWAQPVEVKDQHLLLNQPGRLPVVAFACGIYDRRQQGSRRHRVSVLLLDKRTGRKVFAREFDNMTSAFELSGDPEKKTVDLKLTQDSVTLTFTDDPIRPSPQPDPAAGVPLRPPKAAGAILNALQTAIGDSLGGPQKDRQGK